MVMSTTLLIGRCPAAVRRAFSHSGEGAIVTFSKTRAVKRGHRSGHEHLDLGAVQRAAAARVLLPGLRARRRAGRGVQLAGDAVHAEAVGPVRGDLELEHLDGDRQHLGQRRPRGELGVDRQLVEHEDALPARADLELALGRGSCLRS